MKGWYFESYRHSLARRGYRIGSKVQRRGIPAYMRPHVPGEPVKVGKKKERFARRPKSLFIRRSLKVEKVSPRMKVVYGINKVTRKREIQSIIIDTRRNVLVPKKRKSLAEYYNIAPEVR